MGASWMNLTVFEHFWHFESYLSFLLLSRKEEYVDGGEKSLFWKIDFIHKHLPSWLRPNIDRKKMVMVNLDNGSTISGESTNADAGRGDRKTAALLDEFAAVNDGPKILAATRDTTRCRVLNSTPQGMANSFAQMAHLGTVPRIDLHWTQHPEKARGLYYDAKGKPRSPWYDAECASAANLVEIAQELDIDFTGSAYTFFDVARLEELKTKCLAPHFRGELLYDTDTADPDAFDVAPRNGRLRLWCEPTPPQDRRYSVGADIAAGTGSSNSVLSVFDLKENRKVAEFVDSNISPEQLAVYAVSLCKLFRGQD